MIMHPLLLYTCTISRAQWSSPYKCMFARQRERSTLQGPVSRADQYQVQTSDPQVNIQFVYFSCRASYVIDHIFLTSLSATFAANILITDWILLILLLLISLQKCQPVKDFEPENFLTNYLLYFQQYKSERTHANLCSGQDKTRLFLEMTSVFVFCC